MYCTIHLLELIRLSDFSSPLFYPSLLGAHLRCPVSTTVQFSLRNEGSSEYMCLCEGRESLRPNFQTFQDPRHQFHGIGRLVSVLLFRGLFIASCAGGNDSWEIFALLKSLKIWALENYVCLLRHTFTGS
jgi:hypothetical protein